MKLVTVALLLALPLTAAAQQTFTDPANLRGERVAPLTGRELPVDQGTSGLQQMLRKLNTRASLMLIVAHPDDEDGGMLTYVSRGLGARVATLTLNRGEGGQNAMTGDFEDALGLLRTQELLSADRYFDADQMFGTEVDFGFSKTKEEAFAKWTHERVLYDAVRAVRLYRPLVIASVFIGGVTDGHGQHQVSGEIAQEVFKAAGDPKVFPELTAEGILPWQPLKVYARVPRQAITDKGLFDYATGQYAPAKFVNYVTGEVTTTVPSVDVTVHEGETDPLLVDADGKPRSYVQFARVGLGLQKSQIGPGMRIPPAGRVFDVGYHLYGANASRVETASRKPNVDTFFDGVDTSLVGIASLEKDAPQQLRDGLTKLSAEIAAAASQFSAANPAAVGPQLAEALHEDEALIALVETSTEKDSEGKENVLHELRIKHVQLNDAVALAFGLTFDATSSGPDQIAGSASIILTHLHTDAHDITFGVDNEWLQTATSSLAGTVPASKAELGNHEAAWFAGSSPNRPDAPGREETPDLTVSHAVIRSLHTADRDTMIVTRPYFTRDSIETPVYRLLSPELRNAPSSPPALTAWAVVNFQGEAIRVGSVVHDGPQPIRFVPAYSLALSSHAQVVTKSSPSVSISASLFAAVPPQKPMMLPVTLDAHMPHPQVEKVSVPGETEFHFALSPASMRERLLHVYATQNGTRYAEGYRAIGYGDLPRTNYFTPATDRIVPVDLKVPERHRIGYLPGTGDAVPEALASIGLKPTILSVGDLTAEKLAGFDTVILGVRTYNAHPELHGAATQALLDYARGGGNVVVQYQTGEFTGADAPYPLTLGYSAEKVVDETAPVMLPGDSSLLKAPNVITAHDFDGWIEERGHGFLGSWDSRYMALTEVHDPGQVPQRGGLVTVRLGKGRWTYCAFALYRQLPEAVPGAWRVFVDLLEP